jgi:hypothetical protein
LFLLVSDFAQSPEEEAGLQPRVVEAEVPHARIVIAVSATVPPAKVCRRSRRMHD